MIDVMDTDQHTQSVGVIPSGDLGDRQKEALIEVLRIATLTPNWDKYGSPPPSEKAISATETVLRKLDIEDLPRPIVAPLADGGILIEWIKNKKELHLAFLSEGRVEFLKIEQRQPVHEASLSSERQLHSLIAWLRH